MKTFLKMLLATILGGGLLLFIFFVVIISMASLSEKEIIVKDNSILKIDVNTRIYERAEDNPFEAFDPLSQVSEQALGLNEITAAIKGAANDDKIKGIYLNGGIPIAGHATLKEMRNALINFKESGKFIYAYSEIMTQKGLYLTSVADSVIVNPEGFMEWKGLSVSVTYMKEALNKLGLQPEVLRATGNRFKSAVEPYLRQDMSPENKMQLTTLLNSIWDEFLTDVSNSRGISKEELNAIADSFAVINPKLAAEHRLISATAYEDEVMAVLKGKTNKADDEKLEMISIGKYTESANLGSDYSSDKIAVIIAQGDIVGGDGGEYKIGSERISEAIRKARNNEKVKAVVLRVNSPGGSALASEVIWREMDLTRKVKPVVASMGDLAASGGYYISCFADTIVAQPNTITGSIGAFGLFFTGENLMHNTLGLNIETVKTNKYSDLGTFDRALTPTEKAVLISSVDDIYTTFKQRVAEGRGLDVNFVDSVGQGRVWSGKDALNLGLVDVLGGLDDAIEIAKNMAKIEGDDYRIVEYPELEDPFTKLIEELSGGIETRMINNRLGEYARYFDIFEKAQAMEGYQTRLDYDIIID